MYLFSFPLSSSPRTAPQELLIPCYFCQARFYKIPRLFRPEPLLTPSQLVLHYRLEILHFQQNFHQQIGSVPRNFNNVQLISTHVPLIERILYPLLAQLWKAYMEFLANYIPDPLMLMNANMLTQPRH